MKLNKLFWALMVTALPLGFTACSSDDDDEDDTPYVFAETGHKSDAASYTVSTSGTKTRSAVFGEGGDCVICRVKDAPVLGVKATRASEAGELEYIIGTYVKDGAVYTITVNGQTWGTIEVSTTGGNSFTLKVTIGTEEETVAAEKEPEIASSDLTDKLCRSWKPFITRLNFKKTTSEAWIADELDGANFEDVKKRVEREGCIIKDNFGDGYAVSSIFFTKSRTFCIAFTNGKSYVGKWDWTNAGAGDLAYTWDDEENMGCEYESGNAHVDIYTTGVYKGECWLRLTNTIKQDNGDAWDFQLVFRLQP